MLFFVLSLFSVLSVSAESTSDILDASYRKQAMEATYGSLYNAPFLKSETHNVDEYTGSFNYCGNDVVIPGKSGFDFSVMRYMDSYRSCGTLYRYDINELKLNRGYLCRFFINGNRDKTIYIGFESDAQAFSHIPEFTAGRPKDYSGENDLNSNIDFYRLKDLESGNIKYVLDTSYTPTVYRLASKGFSYRTRSYYENGLIDIGGGWGLTNPKTYSFDRYTSDIVKSEYLEQTIMQSFQTEDGKLFDVKFVLDLYNISLEGETKENYYLTNAYGEIQNDSLS